MCSDRSILSLKSCVFTSIVPGCQGGEWCLFRRAQVGLCVCVCSGSVHAMFRHLHLGVCSFVK